MSRIADLLDRDLSSPIEEVVKVDNHDPHTVFRELTEYIATDRIKAEYEALFAAMAAAPQSPEAAAGVWISGFFGSGKSSFAKNLGYVLANREVLGVPASALFLKQVASARLTQSVELLNRTVPCEIFMMDVPAELAVAPERDQMAELLYKALLRQPNDVGVKDLVNNLFERCEVQHPGKTFAFMLDELPALGNERLGSLGALIEEFGRQSQKRVQAGQIPGPARIIVTAQQKLHEVYNSPALNNFFKYQIDLSDADIHEVAVRRVLRKRPTQETILRKLYQENGASLIQSVRLERCSRRTEFDEDQFVRSYPYLPHLIDLSIEIAAGIRRHPNAQDLDGADLTLVKQTYQMLVSNRTQLAGQPVGALVSVDKIYELVEADLPPEKQKIVLDIHRRFDEHEDYPGLAARAAKTLCLMEFVRQDLPRTTNNIAALLVQRVNEAPPAIPVAEVLHLLKVARFVRETNDGWKLYDLDELRHALAELEGRQNAIGVVNPRLPGWHNDLIQILKKALARALTWYTRPLREFNAVVSRSLREAALALDHISTNMVTNDDLSVNAATIDQLSMDMVALEGRLRLSEMRSSAHLPKTPDPDNLARTAYVIGLFGTGRRYINELIVQHIGERSKYFRDTIRLHPGPTPMIYSGHATIRHESRLQYPPVVTSRILESVQSGFANLIFVYRHPVDSLLTNWIWWRTYLRQNRSISGISQRYNDPADLYADLDRNFAEFEAFAQGSPDFFAGVSGPRFLSFPEFVEETELHLQSSTIALRLEDFIIDPHKEFCRIAQVMSVDLGLSPLCIAPPRTRPYGYMAVRDQVPRFKNFIDALDMETRRRIERIGYKP